MSLNFMLLLKIRNAHFSISFSAALTALHNIAKTNMFESLFHIYLDKFCMYSIFTTRWLILTVLQEKNYYMCLECKKKEEFLTLQRMFNVWFEIWLQSPNRFFSSNLCALFFFIFFLSFSQSPLNSGFSDINLSSTSLSLAVRPSLSKAFSQ